MPSTPPPSEALHSFVPLLCCSLTLVLRSAGSMQKSRLAPIIIRPRQSRPPPWTFNLTPLLLSLFSPSVALSRCLSHAPKHFDTSHPWKICCALAANCGANLTLSGDAHRAVGSIMGGGGSAAPAEQAQEPAVSFFDKCQAN